jgi:hypothetical protein
MILASVNLLNHTADTGAIVSNNNEEILSDKAHFLVCRHYLYMGKSLLIGTDLILALHDEDTSVS